MNHLTHMTAASWAGRGGGWVRGSVADWYESQKRSDEHYEKKFANEMKRHWKDRQRQPNSVRRMQRTYICSRPCCGRQSTVSVYTDMEGVRKVSNVVRACKYCGVAWSVTEGKVICDSHDERCARYGEHSSSEQEAAWDALLPPVLSPF